MSEGKSTTKDMTEGVIWKQIVLFALPLMFGNIFQMLYNTVDSIVVGKFVGTEALAAVASTTMIVNIAIFFFNGFAVGAGVVIGKAFGSKDQDLLHECIQTTMAATFVLCVLFTLVFSLSTGAMLKLMSTPADVMGDATTYLRIYFGGISGLLIYNIGSGILRAVGDSKRPLYFLILTSLLNIVLDLVLAIVVPLGIAGVAIATIISQFVSAFLVLVLLVRTKDVYKVTLTDLHINMPILGNICSVALPMAFQSCLTTLSNVIVQGYINYFGAAVMAGWGAYNKIDSFIFLPIQSMANAATTFVSQNWGAGNLERADKGFITTLLLGEVVTITSIIVIWIFAPFTVQLFSDDINVIKAGVNFLRVNIPFIVFSCVINILAGSLRGKGDATGPMVILLIGFVAVRQTYLLIVTRFVANTAKLVGFGYPVGWMATAILLLIYNQIRNGKKKPLAG